LPPLRSGYFSVAFGRALREQFVYSHAWRANDFVMWDNRSTMHRGRRFDPNDARDIRQTRFAGDGPTISQEAH
jgi:alpha-ketoglutarate-dependent 2,4-dichlorophenoxyacetate dioxygenase